MPFPFLNLPYQLRHEVYGHITANFPRHSAMIEYSGLYLSCHEI
jgi:hypothetical protein